MRDKDGTANDAAIARALADGELHARSSALPHVPAPAPTQRDCPGRHGLELFAAANSQRVDCNACGTRLRNGQPVWSCVQCDFDACESCYRGNNQTARGAHASASAPPYRAPRNITSTRKNPVSAFSPSAQRNNPFAPKSTPSSHMCLIPCTIGSITVEMLVDTGAQSSVLSLPLVRQLGLSNRIDGRHQGVAAGVGRARIVGLIRNVVCTFGVGHVEFLMDFLVLEVHDPLVIMGLDQLRKYRCLVDVGQEKLVFGGAGGVAVEMLAPHAGRVDIRSLNGGCIVM